MICQMIQTLLSWGFDQRHNYTIFIQNQKIVCCGSSGLSPNAENKRADGNFISFFCSFCDAVSAIALKTNCVLWLHQMQRYYICWGILNWVPGLYPYAAMTMARVPDTYTATQAAVLFAAGW